MGAGEGRRGARARSRASCRACRAAPRSCGRRATFKLYGKFAFDKKKTYDAGATPDQARAAVTVKPLDLASLEQCMAAVVKEAKTNDPRVLKARIVELERQVSQAVKVEATRLPTPAKIVEKSVLKAIDITRLELLVEKLERHRGATAEVVRTQADRVVESEKAVAVAVSNLALQVRREKPMAPQNGAMSIMVPGGPTRPTFVDPGRGPRQARVVGPPDASHEPSDHVLSKCARALLNVLASRGVATDSQISALSGYRKTSSGFTNALSELRTRGLIDGPKERRVITEAGRGVTGEVAPMPTGPALLGHWLPKLGKCEAALLQAVYDAGTITREDLSQKTGYSITSSGFTNGISGLRVLDLITGPSGGDLTIAGVFNE